MLRGKSVFRGSQLCIFLIFAGALFSAGCQSTVQTDRDLVRDNYWISNDILQIRVSAKDSKKRIPYSMRRQGACRRAQEKIDGRFRELYPEADRIVYTKKIEKTIYTGKGECTLIVHITAPGLRGRIQ